MQADADYGTRCVVGAFPATIGAASEKLSEDCLAYWQKNSRLCIRVPKN